MKPRGVDRVELTEMAKQLARAPGQRLSEARERRLVMHEHHRSFPRRQQPGRRGSGGTTANDNRVDDPIHRPLSSAFQMSEIRWLFAASHARATNPLAFATAKLIPFRLRSGGTFGISRG